MHKKFVMWLNVKVRKKQTENFLNAIYMCHMRDISEGNKAMYSRQ